MKTIRFGERTYIGDPLNVVRLFNEKEVDELVVTRIGSDRHDVDIDVGFFDELASECFMPIAIGGGISTIRQCEKLNRIGVDKFVIGTKATDASFIRELADIFGSQAVIAAVDVKNGHVVVRSAQSRISCRPPEFAARLEANGAGEVLLQSVDKDGTRSGYDISLIRSLSEALTIPVIAAGGAGTFGDFGGAVAAGAGAVASGSAFTFVGPHRAVLITYPTPSQIDSLAVGFTDER